jgi:hypothetical protein
MLEAVAGLDNYKKLEKEPKGNKINQFVLDGLTKKEQKQGIKGQAYAKEKAHFSDTIEKTFYNLMVCILFINALCMKNNFKYC